MVGLGVAFLLFMAFLNVVKSGNLLSESNLLYATLIFYAGAGTLYLGFGVTGTPSYVRFASLTTWATNLMILRLPAVWRKWRSSDTKRPSPAMSVRSRFGHTTSNPWSAEGWPT